MSTGRPNATSAPSIQNDDLDPPVGIAAVGGGVGVDRLLLALAFDLQARGADLEILDEEFPDQFGAAFGQALIVAGVADRIGVADDQDVALVIEIDQA